MPKSIQIAKDISTGAKAQNTPWLDPDHYIDDLGKWRCNLAVSVDARVQYTINGGTTWLFINDGVNLKANCSYGFDIYVRAGDQINFRTPDIGVTLLLGRMDSIKDEG